jgi:DUF1365 family protein
VFWIYVDLEEAQALGARMRLFAVNGPAPVSLHDRDHADGRTPMRAWVGARLAEAGIDLEGGRVGLLCMPRVFGYVFNPLSVYYCFRCDGSLAAVLYEVTNTFGERHSYLFAIEGGDGRLVRHACDKRLYVSPFIDMAACYHFRTAVPGAALTLAIRETDRDGTLLMAAATGRRTPLTDAALLPVLADYPLVTLKVMAAIHWEALRLWLKGVRIQRRPPPPSEPVTVVVPRGNSGHRA